jgi:hypothetical protein
MVKKVLMYRSRKVTDLDRKELLELVEYLHQEVEDERKSHTQSMNMSRMCRQERARIA